MCILCFRWWYVGWPKHGSIGRVLFQTLERKFMTADAITKMFAVWHCFIAPVPFSRKSVRFCRAQVDCHLEQRWNMQSWKRYVHFSLVVRSAWAPVKNVDTILNKKECYLCIILWITYHLSFHRIETLWEPFLKTMSFDIWPFWPLPGASPSVGDGCHRSGPRQQSRLDVDGFPGSGQRSDQCRLDGHRCAAILIFFHGFFAQVQLLEASKSPTELCTTSRSTCHERCEGKPHDWKSSQRGELLGFEESKGIPISVFFVVKNLKLRYA